MPGTYVTGRADVGIDVGDRYGVLVYVIAMRMVQMTIVQVIDVPYVPHGSVSAIRAMLMVMVVVVRLRAGGHELLL